MPIVDIEIVLKANETIPSEMASELADRVGEIFGSPKNGTWVKVHGISSSHYAENGGKDEDVYPVFITILKSSLPKPEEMQKEVDTIISVVASISNRSRSLVHVIYEPEGKGRVAFGGKIVK